MGAVIGFVTGGTVVIIIAVLGLGMALQFLAMFPWRVLVYDDGVEIRYILRPDRHVPRSEVTIVSRGNQRGGLLIFLGPRRTMFSFVMLTGLFEKRSATIAEMLEDHGYRVSPDMPPRGR